MFELLKNNRVSQFGVLIIALSLAAYAGWRLHNGDIYREVRVTVATAHLNADGSWSLPRSAVTVADWPKGYLIRCAHLKSEKVEVRITGQNRDDYLIFSSGLKPTDLVVTKPSNVSPGEFLAPLSGISDERLIASIIEAGIAEVSGPTPLEALRFIAQDYSDRWGYNNKLFSALAARACKEFGAPQIFLDGAPIISVKGGSALVQTKIRVIAGYRGRRNFVLGDKERPDPLWIWFKKYDGGWKISKIEGLKPLGFDPSFLRLLGAEIGLPLNKTEKENLKQACMPCRARMAERFGTGKK